MRQRRPAESQSLEQENNENAFGDFVSIDKIIGH